MLKWLKETFASNASSPKKLSYEDARAALESHAKRIREQLAEQESVEPEILYYLASDQSPIVRRRVAANRSTPQQANKILTADIDDEVRCELARKIGRLLPGLNPEDSSRVRDQALEVMERLAHDSLPRVRAILAEEIKSSRHVPAYIVKQLAQDLELIVCAPVLEYSPLLSDEDLIEIVAGAHVEGRLSAISKRHQIGENLSDAIVASFDVSAIAALLANPNSQIREEALDRVVESASEVEAWHQPVILRADLSLRAVRRIAGFVSASLLRTLSERAGLDESTASFLNKKVRERIESEGLGADTEAAENHIISQVKAAQASGTLNDEFVLSAIDENNRRLVASALAALAEVPKTVVERILVSQSGKAITALVWRSKLSMRVSVKIQAVLAKLPNTKMALAREGVHFPMTQDEMEWHLSYFQTNHVMR